jgi:hypothetical protein
MDAQNLVPDKFTKLLDAVANGERAEPEYKFIFRVPVPAELVKTRHDRKRLRRFVEQELITALMSSEIVEDETNGRKNKMSV